MIHPVQFPARRDWRIGCVGSGFIMRDCHLTAYRAAGFNPVAIASRNVESAREVADRHALPRVHESIDNLLDDESIEVLDIAVPPQAQPEVIRQAAKRGTVKGILAQKPLALSSREGLDLVRCCGDAGIVLSVNQNMRYDQSVRAAKQILPKLGEIVFASIDMRAVPHWMPWAEGLPSLSTFVMSIHHLDTFRYWLGTPQRVLASTRRDPRTKFEHTDGINLYILEYDNGVRASGWDDVWAGPNECGSRGISYRIEGTAGVALGTIGWPKYPAREPSTLKYCTTGGVWHESGWSDVWFPDAFAGTMAQLLVAIENKSEPEIAACDNLETLALCEAIFAAATEHRVTTVDEFLPR